MATSKTPLNIARAIGTVITIITFNIIVVLSVWDSAIDVPTSLLYLYLLLIGGLLGSHSFLNRMPLSIDIGFSEPPADNQDQTQNQTTNETDERSADADEQDRNKP